MHLPKNGLPRVLGSFPVCLSQADEACLASLATQATAEDRFT